MHFESTVRIHQNPIAALHNSLTAHAGLVAMAGKVMFAVALILAIALAANTGMLDMLFYHDVIPYGLPAMDEVSPLIGAGTADAAADIKFM